MPSLPDDRSSIDLQAGLLKVRFDCESGALHHVRIGEVVLWRTLMIQIRDDQWQSVAGQIRDCSIKSRTDSFEVRFQCHLRSGAIQYQWQGTILGSSKSEIEYDFQGQALNQFWANRIGFCLLHDAVSCEGRAIRQIRVDGSETTGMFPLLIEPQRVGQYSICELQALEHAFAEDGWARAEFDGDTFETEDQRNWCDASFKTYCPPLTEPFPVEIQSGDQHTQKVRLGIKTPPRTSSETLNQSGGREHDVTLSYLDQPPQISYPVPEIGLSLPQDDHFYFAAEGMEELCDRLNLSTLRLEWYISDSPSIQLSNVQTLSQASKLCQNSEVKLDLAIQFPSSISSFPSELETTLRKSAKCLKRVTVYRQGKPVTTFADLDAIRSCLQEFNVPIGGGSDANFCELNREQTLGNLPLRQLDFVSWSVNPQVHANDDESLMETPAVFPRMVQTARNLFPGMPLVVAPITLKPRFNAVATGPHDQYWPPNFASDLRQTQDITAAWAIAAFHGLCNESIQAISLFETTGARGIAEIRSDAAQSLRFYPVGEAWHRIAKLRADRITPLASSNQCVSAALLRSADQETLSLANLSPHTVTVHAWGKQQTLGGYETKLCTC